MCVCTDIIIKSGKSNVKRLIKEPNQDKVVTFTKDVFALYPYKMQSQIIMDIYWILALQVIPIGMLVYFYFQRKYSYWATKGVAGPEPGILKFGNIRDFSIKGQTVAEIEWSQKYDKVYGIYQFTTPILTIQDPELVKQVLVKDFHIFVNRDQNLFDHEYFNSNLFNSEDETWRRIRSIASPSFTTGKLKGMHEMMNKCVDKLENYFEKVSKVNGGEVNVKEILTGFTVEVIASTSFATETNPNGEMSSENIFVKNATNLVDFAVWRIISFFVLPTTINKLINNSVGFDDRIFNFFINLAKEIVKQRKSGKQSTKRNDLVQLLMDAYVYESDLKGDNYEKLTASVDNDEVEVKETNGQTNTSAKKTLDEKEIIAQCLIFFIAGFETTATTLSMASYFLALNPEVQERLHDELTEVLDGLEPNSAEYFDKVNGKIPYLDAVVKETLRRNPPVARLQRRCGVDGYKLGGVPLEKDIEVQIPVYGLHHNPEYYPEPDRFDPERFMPENKDKLIPYTYLPFGQGPRNCVGMRFAYQEMKLCLAQIVRRFRFERTSKTQVPLKIDTLQLLSSKNIQLRVCTR